MSIRINKKFLLAGLLGFVIVSFCIRYICLKESGFDALLMSTKDKITKLKRRIKSIEEHNPNYSDSNNYKDVTLYIITPTYSRYTQQADLVRMSNTLKHVRNLHWIIVEDSDIKTKLVRKVLRESGISSTQLNIRTRKNFIRGKNDPRWKKHRGVDQRNLGLQWLRSNLENEKKGVVYFADDDNTYHLDLFKEMRTTKTVSMWPVALVGALRWEGPVCQAGKVLRFFTGWKPSRKFPVDMASFAVNLRLLLVERRDAKIDAEVQRGFIESDFLSQQLKISVSDIEAKADDCTRILVWHTQTSEPSMKQEERMKQKLGHGSDPSIVI